MSQIAAGFIVYRWFEQNLQFLLLQTSYGIHHWTPPKGHVDSGETTEEAAIRETEEEAGLSKDDLRVDWNFRKELHYMVGGGKLPKTVIYWLAEHVSRHVTPTSADVSSSANDGGGLPLWREVRLSSEHQDYKWLGLVDACRWSAYTEMQQLFKEAEAYIRDQKSK